MLLITAILILFLYAVLGFKKPTIALITSPIVSIAFAYLCAFLNQSELVLVAPVIFAVALIAVLSAKREPDSRRWPHR